MGFIKNLKIKIKEIFFPSPKFFVVNRHDVIIACTMRDDDLYKMEKFFTLNNYKVVANPKEADLILINTCAFDEEREKIMLDLVKKYSEFKKELLITGCVGKINEKGLKEIFSGKYIPPDKLEVELDKTVKKLKVPFSKIHFHGKENILYDGGMGWRKITKPIRIPKSGAVKIANGCHMKCSYCTHKLSIGFKPTSVSFNKIVNSVKAQVKNEAEVIQLLADNLGSYGFDNGSNVAELLNNLIRIFPNLKFALDQYPASYFTRDYEKNGLRELIAKGCIYEIKIPIQSGSDFILKLMKRSVNLRKLQNYIKEATALAPDILWVTHNIIGFPGETEEYHKESLDYLRETFKHNSLIYIFICYVHPNTKSANIKPKVPANIAMKRALEAEKAFIEAGIDVCFDNIDVLKERGECGFSC